MFYNEACGENLSRLGFGCMRLPLNEDKSINEEEVQRMVDYAIEHGVNYFDTAWPYHSGASEIVIGKALSRHPRNRWFLADKYPGHQIASAYNPSEIFEAQLEKCGVEYFDFYLLHNVYENSIGVYTDPRWDILNYFREQKRYGRIRRPQLGAPPWQRHLRDRLPGTWPEPVRASHGQTLRSVQRNPPRR